MRFGQVRFDAERFFMIFGGFVEPIPPEDDAEDFEFVSQIKGGAIPTEFIPAATSSCALLTREG